MDQNPYQQAYDSLGEPVASRVSVLAILSLVCSLVCFVPGLSVLAIILGIAALLVIGSSQGRLTGRGLGIAGLVLGLVVTALQAAVVIGMFQIGSYFSQGFTGPVADTMTAVEQGDVSAVARNFTPQRAPLVTQERIDAFRAAYTAEVGAFDHVPSGLLELLRAYSMLGQQMQGYTASATPGADEIPVPGFFAGGGAIVVVVADIPQQAQGGPILRFEDLCVVTPDGTRIWLIGPDAEAEAETKTEGGGG